MNSNRLLVVLLMSTVVTICDRATADPVLTAPRTWRDTTGKFSVEGTFVRFEAGNVILRVKEDKLVRVPVGRLSTVDQVYVRNQLAKLRAAKNAPKKRNPADDWWQWRGPNHNGTAAAGQKVPVEWSDTKNVIWKVEIAGRGHSSPTVVGDRVILTTAYERQETQSVLCYHRKTGRHIWETDLNRGGLPTRIHTKNTHASPTVASDGERLFVVFIHHDKVHVTALGMDGRPIWKKVPGAYAPEKYKYGYAASPIVYKSTVIVVSDCDNDSFLIALDCATGEEKWRTQRLEMISWSSPIVASVAGREQLLLSGCNQVASYNPDTGEQLWATKATTAATCGTMLWNDKLVFASGGYPKAQTVCIRGDGSGEIVWQNNQKCYEQSMLIHEGHIYAVTDAGVAYCWQANNGKEMWKERLRGPVSASPILAGGNIYATNERGTTFVFRANPEKYEAVAQNQLGSEGFATTTICRNRIFIRGASGEREKRQEVLYCIGEAE